jgi:hypothetical protein
MTNDGSPPVLGIAHHGGKYAVCLGDAVIVEEFDDFRRAGHPESRARRDARIVREAYAAVTGRDLGEPTVLDLELVEGWLLDNPAADPGEADRVLQAWLDRFEGASWVYPQVLAGYAQAGVDGAVAAITHWFGDAAARQA